MRSFIASAIFGSEFGDSIRDAWVGCEHTSGVMDRNIAEGYCRRSINEYLYFLNIALGSLGETVSGLRAYREAKQITETRIEKLDRLTYKLENGLLKLVESLERKREHGEWIDHINGKRKQCDLWQSTVRYPNTPKLQYSNTSSLVYL